MDRSKYTQVNVAKKKNWAAILMYYLDIHLIYVHIDLDMGFFYRKKSISRSIYNTTLYENNEYDNIYYIIVDNYTILSRLR